MRSAQPTLAAPKTLLLLALGLVLLLPQLASAQTTQPANTQMQLFELWERGHFTKAKERAMRRDDLPALLVRAEYSFLNGEDSTANRLIKLAKSKAKSDREKRYVGLIEARLLHQRGKLKEAEAILRTLLKKEPDAHSVRLELGELLVEQNKQKEAKIVLGLFQPLYNNGRIKTSRGLVTLGKAMRLTGDYDDANYAFKEANKEDPQNVEALRAWADLLLSKYNIPDALRTFNDAYKLDPNNPHVLVGMALAELSRSNQYERPFALLQKAEEEASEMPQLWMARARIGLLNNNCEPVYKHTKRILDRYPRYLPALAFQASCHYLDDDKKAFEAVKKKALTLNPKYSELLTETGEWAVRNHRYVEAVGIYRDALKLRDDDANAYLGLGIGLSRVGKEDEALEYLRKAYTLDAYNVRTYNMLELYEKTMPKRYSFTEFKRFKLRSHNKQRKLLNHLIGPVVEASIKAFDKKYKIKAPKDLRVEIYPNPQTFGVRTVGLPNISPHGVCFGKVVLSRSPSDGNFNWHQVIWHEMAHVYHLEITKGRVPRWFTEGLAEYETNIKDPSWLRHTDREIVAVLYKEGIPSVLDLDKGFTHAKSYGEILRSYHLASLTMHYIAQEHGFDKIVGMLNAFGDSKNLKQTIKDVLKLDVQGFDKGFVKWLKRHYLRFEGQIAIHPSDLPTMTELQSRLRLSQNNPQLLWKLALLQLGRGQVKAANANIKRALRGAPRSAEVNYAATIISMAQGRAKDAKKYGNVVLDALKDGYDLRISLGTAALMLEDVEMAKVHFHSATVLYPDGISAWAQLAKIAKTQGDKKAYARALDKMYVLNQNDPLLARKYFELQLEQNDKKSALHAAHRWVDIDPFNAESHRAVIKTAYEIGQYQEAKKAYISLAYVLDPEKEKILLEGIRKLRKAKQPKLARSLAQHAKDQEIDAAKVDDALKGS